MEHVFEHGRVQHICHAVAAEQFEKPWLERWQQRHQRQDEEVDEGDDEDDEADGHAAQGKSHGEGLRVTIEGRCLLFEHQVDELPAPFARDKALHCRA